MICDVITADNIYQYSLIDKFKKCGRDVKYIINDNFICNSCYYECCIKFDTMADIRKSIRIIN